MPVELPHLAMRSAPVHDYVYFTGGMVGIQFVEGWGLIPTREEGKPHAIGPLELTELLRVAEEANCGLVGFNQVVKTGESIPFETWRPAVAWQRNHLSGADSWDAIAQQARDAGDPAYAQEAASLSECLRAAGVRLRDASNSQLTQLKWALREGIAPGVFFTNAGTYPLYLALRTLLAELRAARTCLGRLTGLTLGLSSSFGAIEDLFDVATQAGEASMMCDPSFKMLADAWGIRSSASWLQELGDSFDRTFPASASIGLRLIEVDTSAGPVLKLRVSGCIHEDADAPGDDPAVDLLDDYNRMEELCQRVGETSRHWTSAGQMFSRRRQLQKFASAVLPRASPQHQ